MLLPLRSFISRSSGLRSNVHGLMTFGSRAYATPATKSVFDTKALQYSSKHIRHALQTGDVVFYTAPPGVSRTFFYVYISAGVQLLFCDAEDAPIVLAPQGQRMAIAGGLMALGIGIASIMFTYPWRYIDKIILLKGGARVRLLTHARFIESQKCKEYPINRLFSKQKVFTGAGPTGTDPLGNTTSSNLFLRASNERMGYMLDRKGSFMDSYLFDGLWYKPSAK
ncbi:hypothetical protein J3Q64DRAFT_1830615 [Phycomyces blakesleeanus]|uniref:Uncharacterized protein n=2 Tax=Phycomyces blakesleeanus TaxID=4837 RepID=A0A163AYR5_PHYB8|nr:hypothetical protein PHYBLDRAFT_142136 [Phycomyces blakesleeanus NRRL 1555(-)]OAD76621.1 hypothetical protein PHYBLDRAFT_142136 [Phycomyces blakesleeanus NRRL 1555(-)]|eukprot:XP_018294661.1 hypothetical protein PHYBLDRAFT_142136 [Phycomyces blakesleeanus NRRL 1555(-)]